MDRRQRSEPSHGQLSSGNVARDYVPRASLRYSRISRDCHAAFLFWLGSLVASSAVRRPENQTRLVSIPYPPRLRSQKRESRRRPRPVASTLLRALLRLVGHFIALLSASFRFPVRRSNKSGEEAHTPRAHRLLPPKSYCLPFWSPDTRDLGRVCISSPPAVGSDWCVP